MKLVGYACCPSDAMPQIKEAAKYITTAKGGEGAVREIVDQIINTIRKQ